MAGKTDRIWNGAGAVLAGRDISCRRGERLVFEGLDFDLRAGELLLLRGPNGSGKSTLLRLLAGLIPHERGALIWNGARIADDEAWRAELAYLGHLDAAKPELTPREDLRFWMALRGATGTAEDGLERLGLANLADLPCRLLSQGQRRRLALARIAASGARLWLLDEPFNALDEAASLGFRRLLARHRAQGGMAVLAAHGPVAETAETHTLDLGRLSASPMPGGE